MKTTTYKNFNLPSIVLFAITILAISITIPAYSQVDYSYGINKKGIRIGAGVGFTMLMTHYDSNPIKPNLLGSVDYDFNPYFSVGVEGQIGTLKGIDMHTPHHFFYTSSTNQYKSANINVKASVGLLYDFHSKNGFQDALKRTYVGVGYGVIKNDITFTTDPNLEAFAYPDTKTNSYLSTIPFNFGTIIDLPKIMGKDRLEINPNYQFSYIPSLYSDGFYTGGNSHLKGFYSVTSVSLKFKF